MAQSFHIWYITSSRGPLPKLFKQCPWGQIEPARGHNFTLNYIRKTSHDFLSWTDNGNLTKLDRNGPCVVHYQTFSNGFDWSRGQKIGFQNAIFKYLLVWNYTAQSFHIWHITPSRGHLPKVLKLCPWGHIWPPRCDNFTLNYIRKTTSLNYFLSWTTYGNLTKLNRNDHWSPIKTVKMILIGC